MGYWKYEIVHDYNATKLISEFREENPKLKNSAGTEDEELDFIMYAEKDDFTISLGRVLLIKMSDAMVNYYHEYKNMEPEFDLSKYWATCIHKQSYSPQTFHFTEDEIAEAFMESVKLQTKIIKNVSVLEAENYIKKVLGKLPESFRKEEKFSREQWDPTLKSNQYLFKKPDEAVNFFIEKCNATQKRLKDFKNQLEVFQSFNIAGFKGKIELVEDTVKFLDESIKNIEELKKYLKENRNEASLNIAYLCGIWGGLVEFIAGFLDIALLATRILINDAINDTSEIITNLDLLEIREGLEEIIGAILKDPKKVFSEVIKTISNYKYSRHDDPELNDYQLQYNEGEDTVLAIDLIIAIVTIVKGIAILAKFLPKFTKWIDDVLARNGRGALKAEEALQEARRTKKLIGVIEYEILNPNLLKKYIDDVIKMCKERGVKLEIKWIDNTHPRFNEKDYLGGFRITNDKTKVIISLRPECPKVTWHHERKHLEDFLELGWKKYSNISKTTPWKHEESVWNYVLKNRNKWSEPELVDAYKYFQDYIWRKSSFKIEYKLKEIEDLGKKLGLIK